MVDQREQDGRRLGLNALSKLAIQPSIRRRTTLLPVTLVLVVLVLLVPQVSATSSCPAGSAYPVVCKCSNGQRERHYNDESFKEARKDPKSCCYSSSSSPQPKITFTPIESADTQDIPFKMSLSPLTQSPPQLNTPVIEEQSDEQFVLLDKTIEAEPEYTLLNEVEPASSDLVLLDTIEPVKPKIEITAHNQPGFQATKTPEPQVIYEPEPQPQSLADWFLSLFGW